MICIYQVSGIGAGTHSGWVIARNHYFLWTQYWWPKGGWLAQEFVYTTKSEVLEEVEKLL